LPAGLVATLALGGIAYAYFTNSGGGTGSASVGTLDLDSAQRHHHRRGLPRRPAADVTIVVKNNGSGAQHVGEVSLASVDSNSPSVTRRRSRWTT